MEQQDFYLFKKFPEHFYIFKNKIDGGPKAPTHSIVVSVPKPDGTKEFKRVGACWVKKDKKGDSYLSCSPSRTEATIKPDGV